MKPRPPSRPAAPPTGAADFDTLLDRGIELFNRQQFFEAHEVWEDAWRVSSGDRALFLQGLIQIAAGFAKWQRGQLRGMAALLEKGVEKLVRFRDTFEGVQVDAVLRVLRDWSQVQPKCIGEQPSCAASGDPPRITRDWRMPREGGY